MIDKIALTMVDENKGSGMSLTCHIYTAAFEKRQHEYLCITVTGRLLTSPPGWH